MSRRFLSALIFIVACGDGADAGVDADVTLAETTDVSAAADGLDVLFLLRERIDIGRLRPRITAALPSMAQRWFGAIPSLHIAVVGTDLGLGDDLVPDRRCNAAGTGAVLRTTGTSLGCTPGGPFIAAGDDASITQLQCRFAQTMGCGIEHTLEAPLAAIATAADPYRFFGNDRFMGEVGEGDQANAGFRRRGVPLVLVVLTKDDDCSFIRRDFLQGSFGDRHTYCAENDDGLYAPASYADAWRTLAPAGLHLFVLGGIPQDLIGRPDAEILADPRMVPSSDINGGPIDACVSETLGGLHPPHRIVRFAGALRADPRNSVSLHSACDDASVTASWSALEEFVLEAGRSSR